MKVIRHVGPGRCADAAYADAIDEEGALVIDTLSSQPNVSVHFRLDGRKLELRLGDAARDLLDLAVAIYVADEGAARWRAQDRWTRSFELIVPVRSPRAWRRAERNLTDTLSFLSGDRYQFEWPERERLPRIGRHRTHLPLGFDAACLFSGGIDSLLGAYDLLKAGRRVLLIGHAADGITSTAESRIYRGLLRLYPDKVGFVRCWARRARRRETEFDRSQMLEDTHRSRSFLFLSIAIAMATSCGIDEVFIPENGLIALNPPLGPARLGTLSTRTAHPRYLAAFNQLIYRLGIFEGAVRNPFLFLSKTDMVEAADEACKPLLRLTVSCAHATNVPRWAGRGDLEHCGYCVPCLYRRVAMIAAGLDDARAYLHNIFKEAPHMTPTATADFRALTAFAQRVAKASACERAMIVLSHGTFAPGIGATIGLDATDDYAPWSEMLLRWARGYLRIVNAKSSAATNRYVNLSAAK